MEVSAARLASELAEKIELIENDPAIPVRAKKSKGEKCMSTYVLLLQILANVSPHDHVEKRLTRLRPFINAAKKDMRDIEHEIAKNRLKNLAIDSKLTSGKWMFFPSTETVDALWTKITKAIIQEGGPLRGKVYTAKVSTYQPGDGEVCNIHLKCCG